MRIFTSGLIIMLLTACGTGNREISFERDHEKWAQERVSRLKSDSGWLNLAGLFWLQEGENTFGSDSSNQIIFPGKVPGHLGTYVLEDSSILFVPATGAGVMYGDSPAGAMKISTDRPGKATLLKSGSLAWYIIERNERYAIRLRDFESNTIREFHGIEYFPANIKWNIRAEYKAFVEPIEMNIPTVMGTVEKELCPGVLRFKVEGKEQELYPIKAGNRLFIVFADETSGFETYGGGRFLYIEDPGKDDWVYINFNRAYNPPCVFTPFATCPLPPPENILSVRIEAGEKSQSH